jgi:major membrane immunogen (membrane-anchored lipoprotein)
MKYLVLIAAVLLGACSDKNASEAAMAAHVTKVAVYQDGRIALDGSDATLEDLRTAFAQLSERKGVVWYYREAANTEPHPNAMLVVQAIVEARLPVSMSTKPDFSDVVLPDGSTKAR